MTPTDNLEPITEEEIKKLFCSISEAKQMEKEKRFFVKIDFNQDLIERLLKGYMEVKRLKEVSIDMLAKEEIKNQQICAEMANRNKTIGELRAKLAEKERVIEKLKRCLEVYAWGELLFETMGLHGLVSFSVANEWIEMGTKFKLKDPGEKARQCLEEVKNGN